MDKHTAARRSPYSSFSYYCGQKYLIFFSLQHLRCNLWSFFSPWAFLQKTTWIGEIAVAGNSPARSFTVKSVGKRGLSAVLVSDARDPETALAERVSWRRHTTRLGSDPRKTCSSFERLRARFCLDFCDLEIPDVCLYDAKIHRRVCWKIDPPRLSWARWKQWPYSTAACTWNAV